MNPIHSNDDSAQAPLPLTEAAAYAALSQITLADRPLEQTLGEVAVLARRVLPETPEASVTLISDDEAHTAAFSGDLAVQLDERQYDAGYGPCLAASVSGYTIQLTMEDSGASYPDFRQAAQRQGVTHSLSVGLPAVGRTIGALNLYSSTAEPFTADSIRIAGTFAGFAGMVLSTVGRHDDAAATAAQLQQALHTRQLISQAQGVLIARHRCSLEEAFTLLLKLSQQQEVRLQEVAQAVVDGAATA